MPLDPELLALLVCPVSGAALVEDGDTLVSRDAATRRRYRVDDGIPVLLVDDSETLDEDEWRSVIEAADRERRA